MNTFSRFLALAALLSFSSVTWGLMIGSTDVGDVDPLVAQTNNPDENNAGCSENSSSPSNELCWINSVLAPDSTTYGVKETTVSYDFVNDSGESVIGFLLDSPTEYFLIKNAQWWGLFENVSNFDWAVINTALLDSGFNLPSGEMTISHVATIGDAVKVPEPGILSLFALGLFAMGLRGRKISKRS